MTCSLPSPRPRRLAHRHGRRPVPLLLLALSACSGDCGKATPQRAPAKPALSETNASAGRIPPLTVFDDFATGELDPARWIPKDSLRGFADPLLAPQLATIDRRVEAGRLRMQSSLTGETSPGRGSAVAHFRATFAEPQRITALEATLHVHDVATPQCAGEPTFTFARATIGGLFFNSGEARGRRLVGDILAVVGVGRTSDTNDPPDQLRTLAVVLSCRRPCYAFPEHLPAERPRSEVIGMKELGPIRRGESTRLGLRWDRAADRFVFWRDGRVGAEVPYAYPDDAAPTIERRHLDVAHFVPRCEGGPPVVSKLDVSFDDVKVHRAASGAAPSR